MARITDEGIAYRDCRLHLLKLNDFLVADVLSGRKRFEVRNNDRLFQTGDLVRFEPIKGRIYRITFVESGYGLENGYVAFGFADVTGQVMV